MGAGVSYDSNMSTDMGVKQKAEADALIDLIEKDLGVSRVMLSKLNDATMFYAIPEIPKDTPDTLRVDEKDPRVTSPLVNRLLSVKHQVVEHNRVLGELIQRLNG